MKIYFVLSNNFNKKKMHVHVLLYASNMWIYLSKLDICLIPHIYLYTLLKMFTLYHLFVTTVHELKTKIIENRNNYWTFENWILETWFSCSCL